MFGVWTLDSHEYYGPFKDDVEAYLWATCHKRLKSFQIVKHLSQPEYEANWRK